MPAGPSSLPIVRVSDDRGILSAIEAWELPFAVARVFTVQGEEGALRGGHGHRVCHQALFAVGGPVLVHWESNSGSGRYLLEPQGPALHISPGIWSQQEYLTRGSVLVVLASHPFDPDDYFDQVPH